MKYIPGEDGRRSDGKSQEERERGIEGVEMVIYIYLYDSYSTFKSYFNVQYPTLLYSTPPSYIYT